MRVLLFTGKGGVGKTTTAAATATLAASRGLKTLVLSTDPARSLSDALGVEVGPEPIELESGLTALQVDPQSAFEDSWHGIASFLRGLVEESGVDALQADELTVLPGAQDVLALLELRRQVATGRFDLIVVDCGPTGQTLRLLALPQALTWYVDRLFPPHQRALKAARPLLSLVVPVPDHELFEAVGRLHEELAAVHDLLTAGETSVRLVLTGEGVVVAQTRRDLTSFALLGYRVDGLVANKLVPSGSNDSWMRDWAQSQDRQLKDVCADIWPLEVLRSPYARTEPVGEKALLAFAEQMYGARNPYASVDLPELVTVAPCSTGYELSMVLPLARLDSLQLARSGDDLIITVGGHRRLLTLPSALQRCEVVGARLRDGHLVVRFEPDPTLWRNTHE